MSRIEKALKTIADELRRTEDALADAKHDLDKWGFSYRPSETRPKLENIEVLKDHLAICQRAARVIEP